MRVNRPRLTRKAGRTLPTDLPDLPGLSLARGRSPRLYRPARPDRRIQRFAITRNPRTGSKSHAHRIALHSRLSISAVGAFRKLKLTGSLGRPASIVIGAPIAVATARKTSTGG